MTWCVLNTLDQLLGEGGGTSTLNVDNVFEVFAEDLLENVKDPVIIPIGRSRLFYHFD